MASYNFINKKKLRTLAYRVRRYIYMSLIT